MTSSVKVADELLVRFRAWSKQSGRSLVFLLNQALTFALAHQREIEDRMRLVSVPEEGRKSGKP